MWIFGIDPGPTESAWVWWSTSDGVIIDKDQVDNEMLFSKVRGLPNDGDVVIEMIQSFGMPAGASLFQTCVTVGRIEEACFAHVPCHLVYRRDIKLHFCNSVRAKDANIRQALIDRFGEPGTRHNPGTLYGVKKDEWSALAVAIYWNDTQGMIKLGIHGISQS